MGYKLAIDFGTTNSVIARWDEKTRTRHTLEIQPLSRTTTSGVFLIPTLVYVSDGRKGEVVVGQAVRDQKLEQQLDNRLFRNFKRTLAAEPVFESRLIDGVPWTEAQAGQLFLRELLKSIPYSIKDIDQLALTVPVAAFEQYTTWLGQTVSDIPAEKIRILDESTAAALGYAITEPGATVLIIDFGGGTLDLSLVRLPPFDANSESVARQRATEKATVIAKVGVALGGSDIDRWLLHDVLRRIDLSLETLGVGYSALLSVCEQAKIALSTAAETTIQFKLDEDRHYSVIQTRADLEILMKENGLFAALKQALDRVIGLASQKSIYREDIQHICLIGGTVLIPSVQQTLDEYFRAITHRQRKSISQMPAWPAQTWKIDHTSIRVDKPFTAVVEGALCISAGFNLDEQLTHGYGLRVLDSAGAPHFVEIISAGSHLSRQTSVAVTLAASHAGQQVVEFVIGQITTAEFAARRAKVTQEGHVSSAQTEIALPTVSPLNAHQPLRVRLSPPGKPNEMRLRTEFSVDALRRLRVSVLDLKTRKKLLIDSIISATRSQPTSPDQESKIEKLTGEEPIIVSPTQGGLRKLFQIIIAPFKRIAPEQVSMDAYIADMLSNDTVVRYDAADVLARRGGLEAVQAFETVLRTGTAPQRASAARHLHHFSWFVAQPLFRQAMDDRDGRVQAAAIFALVKMRSPTSYALAESVLRTGSDDLCLSAVWGMLDHPDPAAIPLLALTLQAHDPEIRSMALEILGATESPEAIAIVKSALSDSIPAVQYAATLSWVELARESCFIELSNWIEQTRDWSRQSILRGFFHATNYMGIECGSSPDAPVLIQALENALNDDLAPTRRAAFLPLVWMRHPDADRILIAGFKNETDIDTKAHMVTAAKHFMSPMAELLLEEALQSQDPVLRLTGEFLLNR